MRFAAKEAVLKALGTGFRGMRFRDVEVIRDEDGRPQPVLHGRAAEVAAERGVIELHLSLSFTHSTAVASAVAITAAHRPKPKEEPADPMAALHASFKEARSMLDGIGEQEHDTDDGNNTPPNGDEHDQETDSYEESRGLVIYALTEQATRQAEQRAVAELDITLIELMRRAGAALADETRLRAPYGSVAVAAGTGNNGGDGWVAARELRAAGRPVRVFTPREPSALEGLVAQVAARRWRQALSTSS